MYEQRISNEINGNEINKYEIGIYVCRTFRVKRFYEQNSISKNIFIALFLGCAEKP